MTNLYVLKINSKINENEVDNATQKLFDTAAPLADVDDSSLTLIEDDFDLSTIRTSFNNANEINATVKLPADNTHE